MKEYKDLLFDGISEWSKTRGLFILSLIILAVYYLFFKGLIIEGGFEIGFWILNVIIPLIILVVVTAFWLFSTNRVTIPNSKELTIGVFLHIDEYKSEKRIKLIAERTLNDIEKNHPEIKLILKPVNYLKSKQELSKYIKNNSYLYDSCIFAKVESGNKKGKSGEIEECIEINEITFSGKFNVLDKLNVFKTSVTISKDLSIRNTYKDWSYVESNSLLDKKKLRENLTDTLLFYSGIYAIYLNKPVLALNILKSIHNPLDSQIKATPQKNKFIGNKNFLSAARLNEILLNLFVINSTLAYQNNNTKKAYETLKECEKVFGLHPQSYGHYIALSRYAFELNKIDESKDYVRKAKNIKSYGTEIYMNQGFFALIDKNDDEIFNNYNELSRTYKHELSYNNFTEVIKWLEDHKTKLDDDLAEFAIGFYSFCYTDENLGNKILKKLRKKDFKESYPKTDGLIKKLMTKGVTKSPYHYKSKNHKKKKRKKRNR